MPKTAPAKELATIPVKINITPSEFALIEAARDADDERKTGTWVRKVALRAARAVTAPAERETKRGGR